jgi:uncharacterized protein YndB with AHSA1/START domain
LVWKAFTEADQWVQWFGEPGTTWEGFTMDARPDGEWAGTMVGPGDAYRVDWKGKFLEVDEPARLVIAFTDQAILGPDYETFTITLADAGAKTELVLRQSGGHLTDEQYEQAHEGTASFMDNMANLLARTKG